MSLVDDPEEICFRYVPVVEWISGSCVIGGIAILVIGSLLFAHNRSLFSNGWDDILFWFLLIFATLASVIGISKGALIFAALTTLTISPRSKYVELSRRRLYGEKVERFYFSQIAKFKSHKRKFNFSQKYYLALVLANRKTIKLTIPIGDDKQETVKLIKRLNKIIKNK